MNSLDFVVLIGTMVGIAAYGVWRTRGHRDLSTYLKGDRHTGWVVIGLSVMATQASAITFLSTPGQGYENGLGFVQNYFGAPFALILISAVFLPIYRRLNVYTAYEFLGRRFDTKTRLLGAAPVPAAARPRGRDHHLRAGDHPLDGAGLAARRRPSSAAAWSSSLYTVAGGSEAVNLTQKYQLGVIFCGMVAAFVVLLAKLPRRLSFRDALALAGGFHKLEGGRFLARRSEPLHLLVRPAGRASSWRCPTSAPTSRRSSATSPARRCARAGSGLMFNAVLQDPHAVLHPAAGRRWCSSSTSSSRRRSSSTRRPGTSRGASDDRRPDCRPSKRDFGERPRRRSGELIDALARRAALRRRRPRGRRLAPGRSGRPRPQRGRARAKRAVEADAAGEGQRHRLRLHHVHPPAPARTG